MEIFELFKDKTNKNVINSQKDNINIEKAKEFDLNIEKYLKTGKIITLYEKL